MGKGTKQVYEFGPFRLDPIKRLFSRNGEPISLPPKVFGTLLVLVERSGQIVPKDEFMRQVWSDAFVEEANLSQNIFTLRKILGRSPTGHQYIETIPKRGYRFISIVSEVQEPMATVYVKQHARAYVLPGLEGVISREQAANSVAILPLFNLSKDLRSEYLSDGIAESIVNSLSQISSLRVMAFSTVFRYKGQEIHPQEVGRELGVRTVAVGKILVDGENLTLTMQLVDVANGWQLWGEQYNRKLSDLVQIQEQIARNIAGNLPLKLADEDQKRLSKLYTKDNEAHQLYLKGRYFLNKRTQEGYVAAIEAFQQAINIDPNNPLAYSGLADSYVSFDFYSVRSPWQTVPIARAAANKALEIDDEIAETHTSVAQINLICDLNLVTAEKGFKRAIELNPRYAQAYVGYAHCLMELGRIEESFAASKLALQLDPLNLDINLYVGWHYLIAEKYEEAVKQLKKTLELGPNFFRARLVLGMAYGQMGQFPAAVAEYEKAALLEDAPIVSGFLGQAYALIGRRKNALTLLAGMIQRAKQTYIPPFAFALIYTGLGRRDEAFHWLEKALVERSHWRGWFEIIPEFHSLNNDPRFADLRRRIWLAGSMGHEAEPAGTKPKTRSARS
jgi:TolB-like protein/DNA-binding winged helix-turn-helix (wHTH) protein/Tfp pilus assembly protein PilF